MKFSLWSLHASLALEKMVMPRDKMPYMRILTSEKQGHSLIDSIKINQSLVAKTEKDWLEDEV